MAGEAIARLSTSNSKDTYDKNNRNSFSVVKFLLYMDSVIGFCFAISLFFFKIWDLKQDEMFPQSA